MADDSILIQIRGDVADINAKLASLKDAIEKTKKETLDMADKSRNSWQMIAAGWAGLIYIAGQVKEKVFELVGAVKEFATIAGEAEEVDRKLINTMRAHNIGTEETIQAYRNMADAIMAKTGIDDEQIKTAQRLLTIMNVGPDKMKDAAEATVLLSSVTGDLEGSAKAVGQAMAGFYKGLAQIAPELKGVERKGLDAAGVIKLIREQIGANSEEMGDTYVKKLKKVTTAWDELKEQIGEKLLPVLKEALDFASRLVHELGRVTGDDSVAWKRKQLAILEKDLSYYGPVARQRAEQAGKVDIYDYAEKELRGRVEALRSELQATEGKDKEALKKAAKKFSKVPLPDKDAQKILDEAADIRREIGTWGLESLDDFDQKIKDLEKKGEELKKKGEKTPGLAGEIDEAVSRQREHLLAERAKAAQAKALEEERKGAQASYEVEKWLTDQRGSEIEKRLLVVDEAIRQQKDKAKEALDADIINQQGYEDKVQEIIAAGSKTKQRITDQYYNELKEKAIEARLAELNIAEKEGLDHKKTILERIDLMRQAIDQQTEYLDTLDRAKDPVAWNSQIDRINGLRKTLADLVREARGLALSGALGLSLREVGNEASDVFKNVDGLVKRTFSSMTDALTDFCMTGKLNFADLANSIIRDMIRITIQQQVTGPLALALGSFLNPGSASAGGPSSAYQSYVPSGVFSSGYTPFHSGGIGSEGRSFRFVSSVAFAGAPRYHDGVGPGERAAIIRDDEGVFTPGQMRALGGPKNVKVEIVNTGAPVQASDVKVFLNLQEMVCTVFLDAMNRNAYGIRSALGG